MWKVECDKTLTDGSYVTVFQDGAVEIGSQFSQQVLEPKAAKQLAKFLQKKVLK